jgi:FkbH-like protein
MTAPFEIPKTLRFPVVPSEILKKRVTLKRELLCQENLTPTHLAILGGSTTSEVKDMLEIFLLAHGIQAEFYESGYNRYSEEVLFEEPALWDFKPDIVFIHTTWRNVAEFPHLLESAADVDERVEREMVRFRAIWEKIHAGLGSLIIQNNFDLPRVRLLGNLEASVPYGRTSFLTRLNEEFAAYARNHSRFLVNDIHYLSAQVGLAEWSDDAYWYNFHLAVSPTATVALAQNLSAILKSVYGKSKKCLVLDLDNTLWGGVIGDDGMNNLVLGRDHPVGDAYIDFQHYVKELQRRGVLLAVCSKNDEENAKEGFSHPDSVLKLDDFSAFKANWNSKAENIAAIAAELNIALNSIVFIDDNPVERALVAQQLPEVAVPDVGSDVQLFSDIIEQERYFEVCRVVQDDLSRAGYYRANILRKSHESAFSDYGEFLGSLEMTASIAAFSSVYLERITHLANKTNQFNLTTRRYTSAQIESIAKDPGYITLCGRLTDKFGDNGLVSVLIGRISGDRIEVDAWLMSCRVLKREMELAMFDALVEECQARKIRTIVGVYIPSKKNALVSKHYATLGFNRGGVTAEGHEYWRYEVPERNVLWSRHIRRVPATEAACA